MQYILTQAEMDTHRQQVADVKRLPSPKKLQEFCTFVADRLILTAGWARGRAWGCILTPEHRGNYCDDCPAREICPHPDKQWSK